MAPAWRIPGQGPASVALKRPWENVLMISVDSSGAYQSRMSLEPGPDRSTATPPPAAAAGAATSAPFPATVSSPATAPAHAARTAHAAACLENRPMEIPQGSVATRDRVLGALDCPVPSAIPRNRA